MDVRFAEIYNGSQVIRKFKVRKIKFDLSAPSSQDEFEAEEQMADAGADYIPNSNYRHYCLGGLRIIFEDYNGYSKYLLFRPARLDTTSYEHFFTQLLKYLKPKLFWKLKPNQNADADSNQIQERPEAAEAEDDSKQIENTLKEIKEQKLEKVRLQTVLEPFGMSNFEVLYPHYASMLPPLNQMQLSPMQSIPYFTNPHQWILDECMRNLLEKQRCSPDVVDNYGETLINFAIKHNKMKSFALLLANKVDVNSMNSQQISPIGQAFISRNAVVIDKLLKHGADIVNALVVDPDVSTKPMSPLCYFIKRMRLGHVDWAADEAILKVLKANEVKAASEADKRGLHKQVARMFSTDVIARNRNDKKIIEEFMMPLLGEFDLLSFRDNKNNNLLHCVLKTFQREYTPRFFSEGEVYKYVPEGTSREEVDEGIKKLVSLKNNHEYTPFDQAMVSQNPKVVNFLVDNFIDKFTPD